MRYPGTREDERKKALLACFPALSAFAYCDKAPREVWLSFQSNFEKPLVYGHCYGLQDAYASVRGLSSAETLLKADAERSMDAMWSIGASIAHVDSICEGKASVGSPAGVGFHQGNPALRPGNLYERFLIR